MKTSSLSPLPSNIAEKIEMFYWRAIENDIFSPLLEPLFASSNLDFNSLHFSLRLLSIPGKKLM